MKRKRTQSSLEEKRCRLKTPTTLLSLLEQAATDWPTHGIRLCHSVTDVDGELLTYPQLLAEAKIHARLLLEQQLVVPSEPALLYFEDNYSSLIWYWATIISGAVPALLPPLKAKSIIQTKFLDHVSELLQQPHVLTSKALAANFEEPENAFKVHAVEDIIIDPLSKLDVELLDPAQGREHEAATYLFTSGSTGPSKAVEFTHHQLVASSQTKAEANRMDSSKVFLSWISFDHSVSICELHLHAMAAGANQVMIPASGMVADPASFWRVLSSHRIAYTFAPNSFLATANAAYEDNTEESLDQLDFSHLEVLFCGGEANKVKTLEKADKILTRHHSRPHAIAPVYGLSETCSAIFYNREAPQYDVSHEYTFASVGSILPGNSLRLVSGESAEVERGAVGAIQLKGPMIFKRYYRNEAATTDCMTEDGWFDTGDTGRLDDAGNLCIVGRTKEVLIINGQNYSSFDLEYAAERAVPGLVGGYTATFSVWIEGTDAETEDLAILFNPEDKYANDKDALRTLADRVADAAREFCGKRPAVVIPLPKHCLPKSSIGKLSRSQLKRSLLAGEFDAYKIQPLEIQPSGIETPDLCEELLAAVRDVAKGTTASANATTTLTSLGIDSLGHLRLKAAIERALPPHTSKLSLARLVGCRTLGDVNQYLSDALNTDSQYDAIVELAPRGSKPTLILGHPGSGEVLLWLPLLPYIPDRRILALRTRGFENGETPFTCLEEMIDAYVAAIKKAEPSGPYCLFGRCFGGLLTFEIAKRLEAQGDEILFLGNIDAPADFRAHIKTHQQKQRAPLLGLLEYLKIIKPEQSREWDTELTQLDPEEFQKAVLSRVPETNDSGLSLQKLQVWASIVSNLYHMARDWTSEGKVKAADVFFRNKPRSAICDDATWRDRWLSEWNDFVVQEPGSRVDVEFGKSNGAGALRFQYVPSRPDEAESDYPAALGPILNDCLSRREAEREETLARTS
ncbi:hypothetical protein Q7P37_005703 [Cladosporium fusiforme]